MSTAKLRWNLSNYLHKPLEITHPTEAELKRWAYSHWVEYQAWLFHHSFLTLHDWHKLRDQANQWQSRPLISIITPVFNTLSAYLRECIYSVQTQTYPDWELCLVNDGSDHPDTLSCLDELVKNDHRVRLHHLPLNQGICHATNQAIAMAHGQYIAFLDHDDRLAPDALYWVVETLRQFPDTDIVYTDRDMLSPEGYRFMHLFKPDWSPETLFSGNYLFHLMVYRRQLIEQLGGMRIGLEGSQDYDLILRAADTQPKVRHIPKILYHWRQHQQSVAMQHNVKEYAYLAGVQALQDTLQRRGLSGTVSEDPTLWRGHYRVCLQPPPSHPYQILNLNSLHNYAQQINQAFLADTQADSLIILGPTVQPLDPQALTELTSWLQLAPVGIVTGKVLDTQQQLLHAGLVQRPYGIPMAIYAGFPETTNSYMAVTAIIRNVSTPHPACCVLKRDLWQRLNGLNPDYLGPYALFDFALRALKLDIRTVYTPFARFLATDWQTPDTWSETDRTRFIEQWATWLQQGDPYYNPHLTLELSDMGLSTHFSMNNE